jgi:hypothetical protein
LSEWLWQLIRSLLEDNILRVDLLTR